MFDQAFLARIDIFSPLSRDELMRISAHLRERKINSGEILFREGEAGEELYLVSSGRVKITVALENGETMEITSFGPGDFFGEMSIFQNEPRSAGCIAEDDSLLLSLSAEDFFTFRDRFPEAAIKIMHRMLNVTTGRLKRTNRFLTGLVRWGEDAQRRALTDELTGLFNRGFFDLNLERYASEARISGQPLSLVMADLDGFGSLNARYGESFCNRLIQEACTVFQRNFGEQDLLTRYGGDEFAFILPKRSPEEALSLCDRVCRSMRELGLQPENSSHEVRFSVTLGLAAVPSHAQNGAALLKLADQALYAAKEAGRDRVAVYGDGCP